MKIYSGTKSVRLILGLDHICNTRLSEMLGSFSRDGARICYMASFKANAILKTTSDSFSVRYVVYLMFANHPNCTISFLHQSFLHFPLMEKCEFCVILNHFCLNKCTTAQGNYKSGGAHGDSAPTLKTIQSWVNEGQAWPKGKRAPSTHLSSTMRGVIGSSRYHNGTLPT